MGDKKVIERAKCHKNAKIIYLNWIQKVVHLNFFWLTNNTIRKKERRIREKFCYVFTSVSALCIIKKLPTMLYTLLKFISKISDPQKFRPHTHTICVCDAMIGSVLSLVSELFLCSIAAFCGKFYTDRTTIISVFATKFRVILVLCQRFIYVTVCEIT